MSIVPDSQAILAISRVMARSLQSLHEIIENECDYKHPKEAMVLMIAFINGVILQLRDKVETLQQGLGYQLLVGVNAITKPDPTERNILDKLNRRDPSLNESISGITQHDLPGAINYLTKKLLGDIDTHLKELPFLFRNDETLLHSLSVIVARLFSALDNKNFDDNVNVFARNVRLHGNLNAKQDDTVH